MILNHSIHRVARRSAVAAVLLATLALGCSSPPDEFSASCALSSSVFGPFGPDQPLGTSMSEDEARREMERLGFDSWLEVTASGTWDIGWNAATSALGTSIHAQLAWLDVHGSIDGLFDGGDGYAFETLRVSRSFQGKIEHANQPLFVGVESGHTPDLSAACAVTHVMVGTEADPAMADVLALLNDPAS